MASSGNNVNDKNVEDALKRILEGKKEDKKSIERETKLVKEALAETEKVFYKLQNIDEQIKEMTKSYDKSKKELSSSRRELNKELKEHFNTDSLKDAKKQLKDTVEEYVREIKSAQEEVETFKKEIDDLETKKNNYLEQKVGNSKKSIAQYNSGLAAIQTQIKEANDKLEVANNKVSDLNSKKEYAEKISNKELNIAKKKKASLEEQKKLQELLNQKQEEGFHSLDAFQEKFEKKTKAIGKAIKEIKSGMSTMGKTIMDTIEPYKKANHEAFAYAKSVGMSKVQTHEMLNETLKWAAKNDIGLKFDKTTDELIKMQTQYSTLLGRNVKLTSEQKLDMMAMSKVIGDEDTFKMAESLDNYGMGMEDTAKFVHTAFKDARKYGISASKLTKTIGDNIKMAQNYTFKNGLKGLESMAKKAVELKTDMSLVTAMADKVSTLEGAISTGAQLQVLGGSFAAGSDPLSMMYEGLQDMEGLFDRVVGIIKGKAYYDENLGQVDMAAMDKALVKQMAQATGVDYNKAMDLAFRQASLGEINRQISNSTALQGDENADLREMVANMATMKGGRAVVNIDGKDVGVNEIDYNDRSKLIQMQKSPEQNMQDMAVELRSINDKLSGAVKERQNEQANATKHLGRVVENILGQVQLMNSIMQVAMVGQLIGNAASFAQGGFEFLKGGKRVPQGVKNVMSDTPVAFANGKPSITPRKGTIPTANYDYVYTTKNGTQAVRLSNGKSLYTDRAQKYMTEHPDIKKNKAPKVNANGTVKTPVNWGGAMKAGAAGGAMSAGFSILGSAMDGTLSNDTGKAMAKAGVAGVGGAIGTAAGAALGSTLGAAAGPIGMMIGGVIGQAASDFIGKQIDESRSKLRNEIAESFRKAGDDTIAELFNGQNALEGAYSKSGLNKISSALSDHKLEASEVSRATMKKLRKSGDLERLKSAGIAVSEFMAEGGEVNEQVQIEQNMTGNGGKVAKGTNHANGGTMILAEKGEYMLSNETMGRGDNAYAVRKINEDGLTILMANNPAVKSSYGFKERPFEKSPSIRQTNIGNQSLSNSISLDNSNMKLDISGTIKLDYNGKEIDMNMLMNDEGFRRNITNIVMKRMNEYDNGGYNKSKYLPKFV